MNNNLKFITVYLNQNLKKIEKDIIEKGKRPWPKRLSPLVLPNKRKGLAGFARLDPYAYA